MGKAYVIGIAGGSASGKTTFSGQLESELLPTMTVKTFHMDHYFRPKEDRPFSAAPITGKMYMDDNHPETMDLARLKQDVGNVLENQFDVVLIEGLLTLWDDEICEACDLKLFVDCKADERIVRRLRRNMTWGLTYDQIADVYLDMVRYRHDEYVEPTKWRADLILNGSSPSDHALQAVVHYIKASASSAQGQL